MVYSSNGILYILKWINYIEQHGLILQNDVDHICQPEKDTCYNFPLYKVYKRTKVIITVIFGEGDE